MENSFDTRAVNWDENPRRIELIDHATKLIFKEIKIDKNQSVLDYGCGTGLLGYNLVEKAGNVTFCDSSSGMLEQVEKKRAFYGYKNVSILNADLLTDDLPGKFNMIFSMLVLHHVKNIPALLEKFYNHLEEEGLFCWIDLDKEDGSFHNGDPIPHQGFEKEYLYQSVKKSGFEPFYYSTELSMTREVNGITRKYPIFILLSKKSKPIG